MQGVEDIFCSLDGLLQPPPLDAPSPDCFWTDGHISRELLAYHIDANEELATRRLPFVERSVQWIAETMPPARYRRMIDLGCGPGVYAERFARAGYDVTGVDFSERSIEYALGSARRLGLSIRYVCENYLTMGLEGPYDLVTLIYCDYGVLPAASREHLMNKVYDALRPGGRFLLDVCSRRQYETFEERRSWEARDGGFWSVDSHLCLHAYLKYPDLTTLHQALVLTREEARSYFIWEHCFTLDRLIGEAVKAGFRLAEAFSDVAGKRYADDSPTIATLLEKP